MPWVRVPPEAADFSGEKSLPQVSLCSLYIGRCLEVCLSCRVFSEGVWWVQVSQGGALCVWVLNGRLEWVGFNDGIPSY